MNHSSKLLLATVVVATAAANAEAVKAPPAPAPAATPALADPAGPTDYRRDLARLLETSPAPRDRALAAQLLETQPPSGAHLPQRMALLRKAAAAAPGDRLVQALWATTSASVHCGRRTTCGDRNALARLDPSNGAAWVIVVTGAWRAGNTRVADAAIARLAGSDRYNEHYGEAIGAWREVFAHHPPQQGAVANAATDAKYALDLARDEAAATAVPDTTALLDACSRTRAAKAGAAHFRTCGRVGRLLMDRAQTLAGRAAGVAVLRAAGEGSKDDDERIRTVLWQSEQMVKVEAALAADPVGLQNYLNMVQANDSEMAAIRYELRIFGIPITPPAQWRPAPTAQPTAPQSDSHEH